MICKNCKIEIPNDSEFCQFCGKKIEISSFDSNNDNANDDSTLNLTLKATPQLTNGISIKKRTAIIAIIVCGVLLVGNIIQIFFNCNNFQRVAELSSSLEKTEEALNKSDKSNAEYKKSVEKYKAQAEEYEEKADMYASIKNYCTNNNIGYASDYFHVDQGIVFISRNASSKKLTLTLDYNTDVTVTKEQSGRYASVEFDYESWYGSTTTLTIKPKSVGVTKVDFSNNYSSAEFSVIIVVY